MYDQIQIKADGIRTIVVLSTSDGTLEPAWAEGDESRYEVGSK